MVASCAVKKAPPGSGTDHRHLQRSRRRGGPAVVISRNRRSRKPRRLRWQGIDRALGRRPPAQWTGATLTSQPAPSSQLKPTLRRKQVRSGEVHGRWPVAQAQYRAFPGCQLRRPRPQALAWRTSARRPGPSRFAAVRPGRDNYRGLRTVVGVPGGCGGWRSRRCLRGPLPCSAQLFGGLARRTPHAVRVRPNRCAGCSAAPSGDPPLGCWRFRARSPSRRYPRLRLPEDPGRRSASGQPQGYLARGPYRREGAASGPAARSQVPAPK